jgi:hypothetical protein
MDHIEKVKLHAFIQQMMLFEKLPRMRGLRGINNSKERFDILWWKLPMKTMLKALL